MPTDDMRERVQNVEQSLRTLARLSESLMQLAKAENGRVSVTRRRICVR
jgi:two-component system OmpR family sensor kinase